MVCVDACFTPRQAVKKKTNEKLSVVKKKTPISKGGPVLCEQTKSTETTPELIHTNMKAETVTAVHCKLFRRTIKNACGAYLGSGMSSDTVAPGLTTKKMSSKVWMNEGYSTGGTPTGNFKLCHGPLASLTCQTKVPSTCRKKRSCNAVPLPGVFACTTYAPSLIELAGAMRPCNCLDTSAYDKPCLF